MSEKGGIEDVLKRILKKMESGGMNGVPTGFKDLDVLLNGFKKQELILIASQTSVGKSDLLINLLLNITNNGVPSVLFSLETSGVNVAKRMLSSKANVHSYALENTKERFTAEDWNKTTMAFSVITELPLHLYDEPSINVNNIRSKCELIKAKYPEQHIVVGIDCLQLISGNTIYKGNRAQELGDISRELKLLARELDMTVIVTSHLNRNIESRTNKRPILSDIRDTGEMEELADVVVFLYRDDVFNHETNTNIAELIVAKHRNGSIGTVEVVYKKEFHKFINIDRSRM